MPDDMVQKLVGLLLGDVLALVDELLDPGVAATFKRTLKFKLNAAGIVEGTPR
jgi:hypothetical protein